ncbi:hypothetical protein D3C78_1331620 [compost metagenome]
MLKPKDALAMNQTEIDSYYQLESYYTYCEAKEGNGVNPVLKNQYFEEVYTICYTLGYSEVDVFSWDRKYVSELANACCG